MKKYELWIYFGLVTSGLSAQTTVDLQRQAKNIDFSGAPSTTPAKVGTTLPATCVVGAAFFKSNAPAGQNLYGCTSTNAWTLQSGGVTSAFGRNGVISAQEGDYSLTQLSDVTAKHGNGTVITMSSSGTTLANDCAKFDTNGNLASAGGPCGSGGALPGQTGSAGVLLTNGTAANWGNLPTGGSGALDCVTVAGQCDVVTALVPLKANANTFTGNNTWTGTKQDLSGALHVLPQPVNTFANIPATCTVGERYFASDRTPTGYACTASNTWTQDSSAGGQSLVTSSSGQGWWVFGTPANDSAGTTFASLVTRFYAFSQPFTNLKITNLSTFLYNAQSGKVLAIGIYDADCNLVATSPSISLTTVGNVTTTLATPVTLTGSQYYVAIATNSTVVGVNSSNTSALIDAIMNSDGQSRVFTGNSATLPASTIIMPATCGAKVAVSGAGLPNIYVTP